MVKWVASVVSSNTVNGKLCEIGGSPLTKSAFAVSTRLAVPTPITLTVKVPSALAVVVSTAGLSETSCKAPTVAALMPAAVSPESATKKLETKLDIFCILLKSDKLIRMVKVSSDRQIVSSAG